MNTLKNILFVSYLKNKGIRRICFVLGILPLTLCLYLFIIGFNHSFYTKTYDNITEVSEFNTKELTYIYNHYPISVKKDGTLIKFDAWKNFFISDFGGGKEGRLKMSIQCHILEHDKRTELDSIWQSDEDFEKLKYFCKKFNQYITQKITVNICDYSHLIMLLNAILFFYLPFLICCTFRWIYLGFKEK